MRKVISALIFSVMILCGCGSVNEENISKERNVAVIEGSHEVFKENAVEEEKDRHMQTAQQSASEKTDSISLHISEIEEKSEGFGQLYEETKEECEPTEQITSVTITVECLDILKNMESLREEKHSLVPENGVMLSLSGVEFAEGESVFDVLKRELVAHGMHFEFNVSPVTNNAYIEGIGNIYEFDCGERSGWKYSVNGEFPRVGCSDYRVKLGDKIVFVYKTKAY